jgi:hypothetical protein
MIMNVIGRASVISRASVILRRTRQDLAARALMRALAFLVFATSVADAQGVLSTAVSKARNAKSAADAHIAAEQKTDGPAQKQSATKAQSKDAPATKAAATGPAAAPAARPDTAPPPTILRESFAYSRDGRRDPFLSLLMTNDLRPAMSDLRLTGVLYDHSGRGNSLATLRDITTNAQYRVGVGSVLGRMRVSAIRTESVVFTIEEFGTTRRDSLSLRDSTNKARGK